MLHAYRPVLRKLAGPPLSWSLPAFQRDGYRHAGRQLEGVCEAGFLWATLHPTFPVSDALQIGAGPNTVEAVRAARSLGLRIRLEPHLDYVTTLSGGPYRWRKDMLADPLGEYFDLVLGPAFDLGPDELTLGSELDDSASVMGERWLTAAERLRGGPRLGHKLNHDWLPGERTVEYLKALDYVALSWYVPDLRPLPEGYVIGEFGLGSSDTSRPWHFDASTLQSPEALAIRRTWYLERIAWLRTIQSPGAASFWTAGQFDVLGIVHPEWRDDAIAEAVRSYNTDPDALR